MKRLYEITGSDTGIQIGLLGTTETESLIMAEGIWPTLVKSRDDWQRAYQEELLVRELKPRINQLSIDQTDKCPWCGERTGEPVLHQDEEKVLDLIAETRATEEPLSLLDMAYCYYCSRCQRVHLADEFIQDKTEDDLADDRDAYRESMRD